MKITAAILPATLALALTSASAAASEKSWHYGDGTTPERWSLVDSDYALCDAGLMQSPIDLAAANARGELAISTNYGAVEARLKLGGHGVQLDFPAGMAMQSGDKSFALLQVHFHTPSEHAYDGKRRPLVAHFVHATKAGELGVLGVTFKQGAANPALAALIDALDRGNGAKVSLDVAEMVPETLRVFRYMGSLTTPPCSEGVHWHVANRSLEASAGQIAALRKLLHFSARSLQPLGNRLLVEPGR